MRTVIAMAVAAFSLTACGGPTTQVRVAQPTFLGGHYFMFGDAACPRAAPFPGQAVAMCHTDAGQPTGERRAALTNQQLEMWKYNQQVAMQRQAQVSAQKSALADRMMNMDFGTNYGYQPMPHAAGCTTDPGSEQQCGPLHHGFQRLLYELPVLIALGGVVG